VPDGSVADFFQSDYQNHFCDDYTGVDDHKMSETPNYYLGQHHDEWDSGYDYGLYGGANAIIKIRPEQNNKIYYVEGNLWADSDGNNHIFFVPDETLNEPVRITIVVKGNIYIGDQIFVTGDAKNYAVGSKHYTPFSWLDDDSAIAIIAMADGESYDDMDRNGKYTPGVDPIIGRDASGAPNPADINPASQTSDHPDHQYATGYQGRMEGSGNIVFGDTIKGPCGVAEAFMYAENNFQDISADSSQGDQNPYTLGNMTAGNRVFLKRNYPDWEKVGTHSGVPDGWVKIGSYYYPPGTTADMVDNQFVVDRMYYNGKVYARRHNPLRVTLDERIKDGSVDLPGLPSSVDVLEGRWRPIAWEIVESAVLPPDWAAD
jgi:hypothetical protein